MCGIKGEVQAMEEEWEEEEWEDEPLVLEVEWEEEEVDDELAWEMECDDPENDQCAE
ncbi:MAG: hypothetical protein QXT28_09250 [Thermofilaceae archaeon]